jgi:hypothetical protein
MRYALAAALAFAALARGAAACPTCGLGSRFSEGMLFVYGGFIAVPFVLAFFVTRHVRRITREGE